MSKEVVKIKIGINQKMNLGNYETRDYYLGLEIEGFDKESLEEVQDAINFGRELCLDDVGEYYRKVKKGLLKGEELSEEVDKKYLDLEQRINNAENEEQLRTLEDKVTEIEDKKMQLVMQKKFNLKLISLKS